MNRRNMLKAMGLAVVTSLASIGWKNPVQSLPPGEILWHKFEMDDGRKTQYEVGGASNHARRLYRVPRLRCDPNRFCVLH